jgi:hypothetical protein
MASDGQKQPAETNEKAKGWLHLAFMFLLALLSPEGAPSNWTGPTNYGKKPPPPGEKV